MTIPADLFTPERFEITGELPTGTTLLEASAGTGKTYTVAALVVRYLAEGRARLDELLVITFGRAASQELRDRVRALTVASERLLANHLAGRPTGPDTELDRHLLTGSEPELEERRTRLRAALADFDAATIATTHQFCHLVLRSLGVAGDTDPGAELVDNLDDLIEEVVDDLYLARYASAGTPPPVSRTEAGALARAVVGDPQSRLADLPDATPPEHPSAHRWAFAAAVRAEVDVRKRRLGILSYDDLLARLAAVLRDPDAPALERIRRRWRIVLVDEFQDTDPVQWEILDRAFTGIATMILIGDPKQSIYGFRGGDVITYLTAAATAERTATLAENWRSDGDLLRPLGVLLDGATLGHPEILVRPVSSALPGSRLTDAPAAFRLRQVPRAGLELTSSGLIRVGSARSFAARDCAADIARLLGSTARFDGRPLRAEQVAVLVNVRDHGLQVQRELSRLGVPAVLAGGGHVFATAAAADWLTLLEALEQPHRSGLVRAAGLTSFFGLTATELDTGGPTLTDDLAEVLRGWAVTWRTRGVAALVEVVEERGLTARVLGETGGERMLTDLRHVAQILHDVATRDRLGPAALLAWFGEERRRDRPTTERSRRLDSDAAAVQILTIHGAKGLQYPVVYLPFAFTRPMHDVTEARFHEGTVRTMDVTGSGPHWAGQLARHRAEEAGEELRECYVALTRAQSQVVAWWAPSTTTRGSGLHRLLFGSESPAAVEGRPIPDDATAAAVLDRLQAAGGPVHERAEIVAVPPLPVAPPPPELAVRRFDRSVDTSWRRTSYSGLIRTAEAEYGGVGSEPDTDGLDDEPEDRPLTGTPPGPVQPLPSPLADFPGGATFGSLVHQVLEHADPGAADPVADLTAQVLQGMRWYPVGCDPEALAAALLPLQHTPLGPLAEGRTLAEIPLPDRLRELDFEFPLAGGDAVSSGPAPVLAQLAGLLRRRLPSDDPLAPYADRLAAPPLAGQPLRGYLSGSIDALVRIPTGSGQRFVVMDYKTNLLGEPDRPATSADYGPAQLTAAMLHSHYPLQAMLYSVVAHRYLRWRLPGYHPDRHLGGVLYLFLRGMCGPDTPVVDGHPAGVFSWRPPTDLVTGLSDLLAGGFDE